MKSKLIEKRKSSFDVDNTTNTIAGIMFAAILLVVLTFVIVLIFGLSIFVNTTQNATYSGIQTNITSMVTNFFALMPVVGTIMAVVVLIGGILLLVLYVKRMKDSGTSGSSTAMTG